MVMTPMWAEQMTAGRGWIALALVVFSGWRAGRLLAGAYFFGVLMTLELYAKASGFSFLPSQFWAAMPYIMAVIVLAVISARGVAGSEAPACLGRPFMPKQLRARIERNVNKEKKMSMVTRRNFMKTAAARPGAAGPRPTRLRRRAAEDRLRLSRAGRRLRLELGAQQGPARRWTRR